MGNSKSTKAGEPQDRVGIIILGMHRSGTSALARVLGLLGCDLPKTLIGGNPSNETGHWESWPVCDLNDAILAAAGSRWDDWLAFDEDWLRSPAADSFRGDIQNVLRNEFGGSRLFVLKDPRLCRFVRFWIEGFESEGIRPLILVPLRNPMEVAASLEARNGFDPEYGNLLWLRHVLDAEYASRGTPRTFTTFDGLLAGWRGLVEQAQSALGVVWPRLSEETAAEIDAFLSDSLRHHSVAPESLVDDPTLSAWLRDTFGILNAWASSGENPEDFIVLDRIREAFNATAPIFARIVSHGQEALALAEERKRNLEDQASQLHQLEQSLAETRSERDRALVTADSLQRAVGEKEDEIQRLAHQVAHMSETAANEVTHVVNALLGNGDNKSLVSLRRQAAVLKRSGLIDRQWYLKQYGDVAKAGDDPARHFVQFGYKEGRAPNPAIAEILKWRRKAKPQ